MLQWCPSLLGCPERVFWHRIYFVFMGCVPSAVTLVPLALVCGTALQCCPLVLPVLHSWPRLLAGHIVRSVASLCALRWTDCMMRSVFLQQAS